MANQKPEPSPSTADELRVEKGQRVVIVALVVILIVFAGSIFAYYGKPSAEVATAVAAVTGVIGTVVGAYFGIQVGAQAGGAGKAGIEAARAAAEGRAAEAHRQAVGMALHVPPDRAEAVARSLGIPYTGTGQQ